MITFYDLFHKKFGNQNMLALYLQSLLKTKVTTIMKSSKLKQEYAEAIKGDPELQGKIAKAVNRSVVAINRWVRTDDEKLTMTTVLNVIKAHMSLKKEVVLTETVNEATA